MAYQNLPQQTPKSFLKVNQMIHMALLAGQIIFIVLVYLQTGSTAIDIKNTNDPFLYAVPILAIAAFAAGLFIFKQKLNEATTKETLKEKLMVYQTALIIQFAPLEGASLFGIVTYMITRNLLFLIISGLIILYFITLRPTKDKLENDLNLGYEEKITFDSEDTPL